jgi:hypothetical protein
MPTRTLVQTALLVALCVAVGYAFAPIPNVEMISACVFASGVWVGSRRGALIGATAEALYSGFNPYGIAPPPLYAAQVLGFALYGGAGGLTATLFDRRRAWPLQVAAAGASGFVMTLVYDLLTNVAVWVSVRETASLAAIVAGGLSFPFPLAHVLVNTAGFAILIPAVRRALGRRGIA